MAISISGTVYVNEGVTPMGAGRAVAVSVNGAAAAGTTTTAGDGTFTLAAITAANGAVLTVYLQGNAELGVRVTVSDGNNLAGADIYQDTLILAKGNVVAPTFTNVNTSDNNGATGITGIYSSTSNTAFSVAAGKTLYIPSGTTFVFPTNGVATCNGSVHCHATSFSVGSGTSLALAGSGSYTFLPATSSTGNPGVNVSGGTYTLQGNLGISSLGNLTIGVGANLDVSVSNYSIFDNGNWSNSGTFTARNGTVTIQPSASGKTLDAGSSSFYNLTKAGAQTVMLASNPLVVTNNLTITGGTLDVSAGNLGVTVGGNWSNSGTFTAQNGTVTLNGSGQTISGTTTFYNLVATNSGDVISFTDGTTQTVSNSVTFQNVTLQGTSTAGWTVAMPATQTINHVTVSHSTATGNTAAAGTGSVDGGNNTNWTFPSIVVLPDSGDVRLGVVYSSSNLPSASNVELGVVYG